jgi:hypothetical protein
MIHGATTSDYYHPREWRLRFSAVCLWETACPRLRDPAKTTRSNGEDISWKRWPSAVRLGTPRENWTSKPGCSASIWIEPVRPIQNWADRVPPIAGLPGLTEEQAERVLEKGIGPQEENLRPPMHIYRMKHTDAKAIVAYLNSIPRLVH